MTHQQVTNTTYQQRINEVIAYIQMRLATPPTLNELASIAAFSPYHFHRIFKAHMGESLAAYVRRLRLEQAAAQLRYSQQGILEIALDVGYETQSTFGKAFKKWFGVTPAAYRNGAERVLAVSPRPTLKELKQMTPTIKQLPPQTILFVQKKGSYQQAASEAWGVLMPYAYSRKLMKKETQTIGISHDNPDISSGDRLRYDACIVVPDSVEPEDNIGKKVLAGGRYAVFLHKGTYENFSQTYDAIFKSWLPNSSYQLRDAPAWERYLNRDPRRTKPENLRTEIYIPLED